MAAGFRVADAGGGRNSPVGPATGGGVVGGTGSGGGPAVGQPVLIKLVVASNLPGGTGCSFV